MATKGEFMSRFVSRFAVMMHKYLVENKNKHGWDTSPIKGVLVYVIEKLIDEMERGGLQQIKWVGVSAWPEMVVVRKFVARVLQCKLHSSREFTSTNFDEASVGESTSTNFDKELWMRILWMEIWDMTTMVLHNLEAEFIQENMKTFLPKAEGEIYSFSKEMGSSEDEIRNQKFSRARDEMDESDFRNFLCETNSQGENQLGEENPTEEDLKIIKYKVYGVTLKCSKADYEVAGELVKWPSEEPISISHQCKIIIRELVTLKEKNDPSKLLDNWVKNHFRLDPNIPDECKIVIEQLVELKEKYDPTEQLGDWLNDLIRYHNISHKCNSVIDKLVALIENDDPTILLDNWVKNHFRLDPSISDECKFVIQQLVSLKRKHNRTKRLGEWVNHLKRYRNMYHECNSFIDQLVALKEKDDSTTPLGDWLKNQFRLDPNISNKCRSVIEQLEALKEQYDPTKPLGDWVNHLIIDHNISDECKSVTDQLVALKEKDDRTTLLGDWLNRYKLDPSRIDWLALLQILKEKKHHTYFKVARYALEKKLYKATFNDYYELSCTFEEEGRELDATLMLLKMDTHGFLPNFSWLAVQVPLDVMSGELHSAKLYFDRIKINEPGMNLSSLVLSFAYAGEPRVVVSLLETLTIAKNINIDLLRFTDDRRAPAPLSVDFFSPKFWASMVDAYLRASNRDLARKCCDQIIEFRGHPSFEMSIASAIASYVKENLLDEGISIVLELEKKTYQPGTSIYAVVVDGLIRMELFGDAKRFLEKIEKLEEAPVYLHISLCEMYIKIETEKKALKTLDVLKSKNNQFELNDFERLISVLSFGGFSEEVRAKEVQWMQDLMKDRVSRIFN